MRAVCDAAVCGSAWQLPEGEGGGLAVGHSRRASVSLLLVDRSECGDRDPAEASPGGVGQRILLKSQVQPED